VVVVALSVPLGVAKTISNKRIESAQDMSSGVTMTTPYVDWGWLRPPLLPLEGGMSCATPRFAVGGS
jgi:hypothetical protein